MKLSKTIYIHFLLYIFGIQNLFAQSDNIDIGKYQSIIDTIITKCEKMINSKAKSENLKLMYKTCTSKILSKELGITINPKNEGIINGSSFNQRNDNSVDISFGIKLLDLYEKKESIVYCILIHEMRHAYDYFENHELFITGNTDEKEKYWFELDALHVEAQFIEECIDAPDRSAFEKFLYSSWKNDNLNSASVIIDNENMNVFFFFNNIIDRFNTDNLKNKELMDEIIDYGNKILDQYEHGSIDNRYNYYWSIIAVKTYLKFAIRTIKVLNTTDGLTWDGFYKIYPEYEKIYDKGKEVVSSKTEFLNQYLKDTISFWESDLVK